MDSHKVSVSQCFRGCLPTKGLKRGETKKGMAMIYSPYIFRVRNF